ncbi:GSCOCT00013830001.3-RA-CDS, partial [Cotesia congregata]
MLDHCGTSYEMATLFGMIFGVISGIIKIILLNLSRDSTSFILKNIIDDWWIIKEKKSKFIMKKYASLNRMLFYGLLTPFLMYTVKLTLEKIPHTVLIDNTTVLLRTIPISSECWNFSDTPTIIYIIRFVWRTFEFMIYNIVSCGIDLYFFVIAMHICGQMEISNMNIRDFMEIHNGVFKSEKFYAVINRQKNLLDMMDLLRESFNYVILAVSLIAAVHLNVIVIMVFVALKNNNINSVVEDAAGNIIYFFSQIYIYCYVSDKMSSKVEESCLAVYSCCWYNFSNRVNKDIVYIMLRNSQKFYLTAGKFYNMNLSNFTDIVKTLCSFFSVMRLVI